MRIAGCSEDGLGSMHQCDAIEQRLQASKVKAVRDLRCMPYAGRDACIRSGLDRTPPKPALPSPPMPPLAPGEKDPAEGLTNKLGQILDAQIPPDRGNPFQPGDEIDPRYQATTHLLAHFTDAKN